MADQNIVHIGENSPEQVAYKLLHKVERAEGKVDAGGDPKPGTDRKWILETSAECLKAAQGKQSTFNLNNL